MNKLKEIRKQNKYSYQDMADKLNISKTFYWQIENNQRRLSYDMSMKIARVFNMKPDDIFYKDMLEKDTNF